MSKSYRGAERGIVRRVYSLMFVAYLWHDFGLVVCNEVVVFCLGQRVLQIGIKAGHRRGLQGRMGRFGCLYVGIGKPRKRQYFGVIGDVWYDMMVFHFMLLFELV